MNRKNKTEKSEALRDLIYNQRVPVSWRLAQFFKEENVTDSKEITVYFSTERT